MVRTDGALGRSGRSTGEIEIRRVLGLNRDLQPGRISIFRKQVPKPYISCFQRNTVSLLPFLESR